MAILIHFHQSHYRTFKAYYTEYVQVYLISEFPHLVSYTRFVALIPTMLLPLLAYLQSRYGACTGISFIDSTALAVCDPKRIHQHRVFVAEAKRGKSSMGWFYGFKLHLAVNDQRDLLACCLTAGNVDDRTPVPQMVRRLRGKLIGDRGYISTPLSELLFEQGLQLITRLRKNMKNHLMPFSDKLLVRKRAIIESIIDQFKNISQIEHSRHRSPTNFVVHLLAGLLKDIGLELKPSKTQITHTLQPYQGKTGFDFLGWTVRQFPVGKTHTGMDRWGNALGFKTIITPSKEAVKRHIQELKLLIRKNPHAPQRQLIKELNQVIHGWTNYYRSMVATESFHHCRYILFQQLQRWAKRRHLLKGMIWISNHYWHVDERRGWHFTDQRSHLWQHDQTKIQRHTKVKGTASPYDGDLLYWSKRLRTHPMLNGPLGKLLQKQAGKCRWCELLFQDGDIIEIDHITPRSQGGGEELSNKFALHRHCHDQRHERRVNGTHDKGQVTEEPDDANVSRPVLKPSGGGDSLA